jgi:tetratricopeptide (TPR) repeat protein
MATKAELESREAECNSVTDFINLAKEAMADPADADYAKELLQKAETQCQMPLDYVTAGDAAAAMGDKDYARELYAQAEDMLFEVPEFMAYAHSLAANLGDKDKAREFLEKAADEASKVEEFLSISRVAGEDLGDGELAKSLLSKVEEKANGFDDFVDLAEKVKESGDETTARTLLDKAARFCDEIPDTVNFAGRYISLFGDRDKARSLLDEAETDCQFTKQFVQLAKGYKDLLEDEDKVGELMDQAAEFCMSGEEHIDLAEGYWTLRGDKDKASQCYEQALGEITDKDQLLGLAAKAANDLEDAALAKTIYGKAEGRMSSASDLAKLAQAVLSDLKDNAYAAEVYQRASEKLVASNDLINLAGEIFTRLGDSARSGEVYRKALENAEDYKQLLKLLGQSHEQLKDDSFSASVLEKAEELSRASPEMVEVALKALGTTGDRGFATRLLQAAEERVTSLSELKAVADAVKTNFSDDEKWIARIDEKLAKREANQAKYEEFQKKENKASTFLDNLRIADEVMEELDDKFYARKLLTSAEQQYRDSGGDLNQARMLLKAVDTHLGDQDWIKRLLDDAAENARNFVGLNSVVRTAVRELTNKKTFAKGYLKAWEKRLGGEASDKAAYEYAKLAKVVAEDIDDKKWAARILNKAAKAGGDHYLFAKLGAVAAAMEDGEKAGEMYKRAVEVCDDPTKLRQLAMRLKQQGVDEETLRGLYAAAKPGAEETRGRLDWAAGLVDIFRDNDWASREYDELAGSLQGDDAARFRASRQSRLRQGLW